MKNTFGNAVSLTLFGESHGEMIGATLDGLAPGMPVDMDFMEQQLARRRAQGLTSTARHESDIPHIVSGLFEGKTTGTPLTLLIANENTRSADYAETRWLARPSHADYTAYCKYHGFEDYRGGGHFSARVTAALVAASSILLAALQRRGVTVATHMARCAGVSDRSFEDLTADTAYLSSLAPNAFPVLNQEAGALMEEKILEAKRDTDSVGGILETVILGLPAGLGEPWFDSVESLLSHGLFSVPAVKGIEFGSGFAFADMRGSTANDPFSVDDKGNVITTSNQNGGINGGITNGMPVQFRMVIKPTASIAKEQDTVNMQSHKPASLRIHGRHDPCVVRRAAPVTDAICALVLSDLLTARFGTDYLKGD